MCVKKQLSKIVIHNRTFDGRRKRESIVLEIEMGDFNVVLILTIDRVRSNAFNPDRRKRSVFFG